MSNSLRLAYLLGEMRREMNGAVVGSMRFYGEEYGLNYGVSLATIRSKAQDQRGDDSSVDHKFSHLLYKQEVRELRLASFWFADPKMVVEKDEFDLWAEGIINSDVAEEAAFVLLYKCDGIESWLQKDGELLHYTAVMALAKRGGGLLDKYGDRLLQLLEKESNLLPKAVVALLSSEIKSGVATSEIEIFLEKLPDGLGGAKYIRDEISWRLEFR